MNVVEKNETQILADKIKKGFDKPPPRKPRVAEDVIAASYPDIQAALDAKWTWKDVIAVVRGNGLKISAARLKKLIEQEKEKVRAKSAAAGIKLEKAP